jgi:hypothetical protein
MTDQATQTKDNQTAQATTDSSNADAQLSTADIASGSAGQQTDTGAESQQPSTESEPLFPQDRLNDYRQRWTEIQASFVDDPRGATEQADNLVATVIKDLAQIFAQERETLEGQWTRGEDVSTEDLRVALTRYRGFFDRLLSV